MRPNIRSTLLDSKIQNLLRKHSPLQSDEISAVNLQHNVWSPSQNNTTINHKTADRNRYIVCTAAQQAFPHSVQILPVVSLQLPSVYYINTDTLKWHWQRLYTKLEHREWATVATLTHTCLTISPTVSPDHRKLHYWYAGRQYSVTIMLSSDLYLYTIPLSHMQI